MLKTIDACGQLAGALSRFLTYEQNIGQVCAAAVEVDIMIEQLRAGGMGAIMADEKIRKLHCLARRLLPQDAPQTTDAAFAPDNLINDALDAGEQALALYNRGRSPTADKRLAARFIRKAVGHFWHAAQHCISEAQLKQHRPGGRFQREPYCDELGPRTTASTPRLTCRDLWLNARASSPVS